MPRVDQIPWRTLLLAATFIAIELVLWSAFLGTKEGSYETALFNDSTSRGFDAATHVLQPPATGGGKNEFTTSISYVPDDDFAAAWPDRISLVFVTYGGPAVKATWEVTVGDCVLFREEKTTQDNETVHLPLTGECDAAKRLENLNAKLKLRVHDSPSDTSRGDLKIGFWTRRARSDGQPPVRPFLQIGDHSGAELKYAVGAVQRQLTQDPWPRLKRLSWMWGWEEHWIWAGGVLNALLLLATGLLGWAWNRARAKTSSLRPKGLALAVGVSSLCFGLVWSFVTPPFQAPDEPIHFATFFSYFRTPKNEAVNQLAQDLHFWRIRYHPDQRFETHHARKPEDPPKEGPLGTVLLFPRSPAAVGYWTLLHHILPDSEGQHPQSNNQPETHTAEKDLAQCLLLFRTLNVTFVATVLGLLSLLVLLFTRQPRHTAHAATLLSLPSLAFFSAAVTTYTPLIMALVLLFFLITWLESAPLMRFSQQAVFFTLSLLFLVLCFWSSRVGVIYGFAGAGFLLLGLGKKTCFLPGQPTPKVAAKSSFAWGMALAVLTPLVALAIANLTPKYFGFGHPRVREIVTMGFAAYPLAALLTFATPFAEGKLGWNKPQLKNVLLFAAGAITLLTLYVSLAWPMDGLHNIEKVPLSPGVYIWDAVKTFVATNTLGAPEFYLAETFWSGFGWLEAMWSPVVTKLLQVVLLTGLIAVFFHSSREMTVSEVLRRGAVVLLVLITVATLALGAHQSRNNLHGRYLIGIYIILTTYSLLGWSRLVDWVQPHLPQAPVSKLRFGNVPPIVWFCAGVAGLNSYAIFFVFNRFF